jgi:triosephosphate isomerase
MSDPRRPLIAGNWKMNLRLAEVETYCRRLVEAGLADSGPEVAIFPSPAFLETVSRGLAESGVSWGGQDLHPQEHGAHTGDTSALQLVDFGCRWVLCGHSERRADWHESDELVAAKLLAALRAGLEPVLCVGESREERHAGDTESVLGRQLATALVPADRPWVLAYEPVWAIGTGLTATPEIAQEAHLFLRSEVRTTLGDEVADGLRILYGGSVKPANCEDLLAQPDIDGFLIGGASLDPDSFLDIIRRCGLRP